MHIRLKVLAHRWPRGDHWVSRKVLLNVCMLGVKYLVIIRVIGIYIGNLDFSSNLVLVHLLHLSELCFQHIHSLLPMLISF